MSTGYVFADFVVVVIGSALVATLYNAIFMQVAAWLKPDLYESPFGDVPNLPRRDQ
jgi:hypothetical protein